MVKTNLERSKTFRKRQKDRGLVQKVIWCAPEAWDAIREFIEFQNAKYLPEKKSEK